MWMGISHLNASLTLSPPKHYSKSSSYCLNSSCASSYCWMWMTSINVKKIVSLATMNPWQNNQCILNYFGPHLIWDVCFFCSSVLFLFTFLSTLLFLHLFQPLSLFLFAMLLYPFPTIFSHAYASSSYFLFVWVNWC